MIQNFNVTNLIEKTKLNFIESFVQYKYPKDHKSDLIPRKYIYITKLTEFTESDILPVLKQKGYLYKFRQGQNKLFNDNLIFLALKKYI